MLDPTVIDALVTSGCSVEVLAAAVKADAMIEKEKLLAQRAAVRERVRRHRANKKAEQNQQTSNGYDALHTVTSPSPLLPPSSPDKEKVSIPLKEINPSSPLYPPSPSKYYRSFEEFWEIYPRKTSKLAASKAFAKQIKNGIDPQTMIDGARNYQFHDDLNFVPHASTWLNGQRWQDLPPPSTVPRLSPNSPKLSPRLQVIINNRKNAREYDLNCLIQPEEQQASLGQSATGLVPSNGNANLPGNAGSHGYSAPKLL